MPNDFPGSPDSHCASVVCGVPARVALSFLADGLELGRWALGCWQTEPLGPGLVRGRSLFDDQPCFVRAITDEAGMTVIYHVGATPDALNPRISARVEPIDAKQAAGESCRISLHALRAPDMDDARWLRLMRSHEVEVLLIQARLDLRHDRHHPAIHPLPETTMRKRS